MTRVEAFYAAGLVLTETPERVSMEPTGRWRCWSGDGRLAEEFAAAGKGRVFELLKQYLAGDRAMPYAEAAQQLGISEVTARVAVHRMRGRFRDLIQEEVAQTLADGSDARAIDEELRFLLSVL